MKCSAWPEPTRFLRRLLTTDNPMIITISLLDRLRAFRRFKLLMNALFHVDWQPTILPGRACMITRDESPHVNPKIDGRNVVNSCSNDYLGLANQI
jgi:hypothetical protein